MMAHGWADTEERLDWWLAGSGVGRYKRGGWHPLKHKCLQIKTHRLILAQ